MGRIYGRINGHPYGDRDAIGIKTYRVPVDDVDIFLPLQEDVAPLILAAAREFHRRVEPLHEGWCWGYADRNVRGSTAPSFHWAGIATDKNAPRHPLGAVGTFNDRQVAEINRICAKYGLRWGGNYSRRKDEMHFEVIVSREEALAMIRKLQTGPPTIKRGTKRTKWVRKLQRRLNLHLGWEKALVVDGKFGAHTDRAVMSFQRKVGLKVDGIVGVKTWKMLLTRPQ